MAAPSRAPWLVLLALPFVIALDRAALAQRLVETTGMVEVTLDVVFAMARAAAHAVDAVQPTEKRLRPGQLEAQLRAARDKAYEPMRVNAVITVLFTYRTLPPEDLEACARFSATPPARWFVDAARRGLVDAIGGLTERAMTEVAPSLPTAPRR